MFNTAIIANDMYLEYMHVVDIDINPVYIQWSIYFYAVANYLYLRFAAFFRMSMKLTT